jgi:aerobic carbon-monoxide dehydrogenase large subunit
MEFGIGKSVRRIEDFRLLTGAGSFSDDANMVGQLYAYFLRSPHAHADIVAFNIEAACAEAGVQAVLMGQNFLDDGLSGTVHMANSADVVDPTQLSNINKDDSTTYMSANFPLAVGRVRHVGEAVAVVVADSLEHAKDAAELIEIEYEPLPVVITARAAAEENAPQVWSDAPGNICVDLERGDKTATDNAFANADHIVAMRLDNPRLAVVPTEPRGAVAFYDAKLPHLEFLSGNQGAVMQKLGLARIFGLTFDQVRVVSKDVGGGFGMKFNVYPEHVAIAWASKRLSRPVKWVADRTESFLSDLQARDFSTDGELALSKEGDFLGLRISHFYNVGAQTVSYVPLANSQRLITGCYKFPAAHLQAKALLTNTVPTAQYRGAGRPETIFNLERMIDIAARQTGLDRMELRRRNLVTPDDLPYTTRLGLPLADVEFPKNMQDALEAADWSGFEARREVSAAKGKLRGFGFANYMETPTGRLQEEVVITIQPEGIVQAVVGTGASGQGHDTVFSQVLSSHFGLDFECIDIISGDTAIVEDGGGSHSDRSMRLVGSLLTWAAEKIIETGKERAAQHLEAEVGEIEFGEGFFQVQNTNQKIGLFDIAANADAPWQCKERIERRLPAYPCGAVGCEVEIDPETGGLSIVSYVAVDDVGIAINPLLVDGQIHGGIAQGVGQALMEEIVYDEMGQLITGSLMDYSMPRADNFPTFKTILNEVASSSNPLGIKGAGEGGTTPAPAVIVSAVVDALKEYGVEHIEMPVTAERIWQAIKEGK